MCGNEIFECLEFFSSSNDRYKIKYKLQFHIQPPRSSELRKCEPDTNICAGCGDPALLPSYSCQSQSELISADSVCSVIVKLKLDLLLSAVRRGLM